MTRSASPRLDTLDPDVLEAARDVARRAGVPVETWIASVIPPVEQERRPRRRRQGREAAPVAAAAADRADRPNRPDPSAEARPGDRMPAPGADIRGVLDALTARLDGLDRGLAEERRALQEAAGRRLEEIESRIGQALGARVPADGRLDERLGDIERRIAAFGEQIARPPLRRPAAAEIRDAVQDIRRRQRDLAEGGAPAPQASEPSEGGAVAAMRHDLARRLDAGPSAAAEDVAATVSDLQRESSRLRASIGQLTTGRDVGALEQAVISLADGVERAAAPADLAAISGPIEAIRAQVERLADEVAESVHGRVARDVDQLATRIDAIAAGSAGRGADRDALSGLFGELDEIRRLVAGLAGPERIQGLAQGLQAMSAQIAQLQDAADRDTALRPLLEEIRSGLGAPAPVPPALTAQIQALSAKLDAKLDALGKGRKGADAAASDAILGRIDALADKVERARPVEDLIRRLEGLEEILRRPAPGPDVAAIHATLRTLAEKVDRVGARVGGEGLDGLERQVMGLASRLDGRGADPALASLARSMDDLLGHVSALGRAIPDEAAIARAVRGAQGSDAGADLGPLRADLADLQARHAAADQRLGQTLSGLQSTLDGLVGRLASAPSAAPSLDERLLGTAAAGPRPGGARRSDPGRPESRADLGRAHAADPSPNASAPPPAEPARAADQLLEPGAGRPGRQARLPGVALAADAAESPADIKTNFIAAARRAAQAAQAELASETALSAERRGGRPAAPAAGEGRLARLRAEIERRRRPLLLGLAAVVLALGALQAVSLHFSGEPETRPAPPPVAKAAPAPTAADAAPAAKLEAKPDVVKPEAAPAAPAKAPPADPPTTQALPAPARSPVPQIATMSSLGGDLAAMPAGLAKLRQAALDGDGAAIWELAGRQADGRGVTRDLALAAKLYEKLAVANYAPAQYKLAGHYEKGSGVVRDLGQAKLWYGRAAEQGHARAMHNLAVLYAENPAASGKPDYASAASWFRQGAEYGVRDSQFNLAVLYARGLGVTQDLVQSYAWFSAAAAQGDEDAGKKRDDVASKLSPGDLANARSIAGAFKPRKLDAGVNEPPAVREPPPMSLLGAPTPRADAFTPPAGGAPSRRSI